MPVTDERSKARTEATETRVGGRRPSAAVAIHSLLRDEIVTLVRVPGEPVNERAIAGQFGVSRTPVREALLQLAAEGLIELVPQVGTFIARIPLDQLPEAVLVRQALEETTARLAATSADARHIAAMRGAIMRQLAAAERCEVESFHAADEELHAHIADASGYPGIWRLVRQAKVQLDRYRRATLPQIGRLGKVIEQHQAIVAAIERHDATGAAELMRQHVTALVLDLSAIRALHPDWFTDLPDEAAP
jgi:DNA-binding GntR family transcriptional regulator